MKQARSGDFSPSGKEQFFALERISSHRNADSSGYSNLHINGGKVIISCEFSVVYFCIFLFLWFRRLSTTMRITGFISDCVIQ